MTALCVDLRLLTLCILQNGADQWLAGHILLIAHRYHNVLADLPRRKRERLLYLLRLLRWLPRCLLLRLRHCRRRCILRLLSSLSVALIAELCLCCARRCGKLMQLIQ